MSNAMLQQRYGQQGGTYPSRPPAAGVQSSTASSNNPLYVARSNIAPTSSQASNTKASSYTTSLKKGNSSNNLSQEKNQEKNNDDKQSTTTNQKQRSLAHALLPDLPLLMHGSGDVLPEHVHPHSVATLAQLIEKYVASLVSAAMDSHDVFTDGQVVGGGACLGIPPFNPAPGGDESDDEDDNEDGDEDDNTTTTASGSNKKRKLTKSTSNSSSASASTSSNKKRSKKKHKQRIDYWDVPLPPPSDNKDGLDSEDSSRDSELSDEDSYDDAPLISPFRRLSSTATTGSSSSFNISDTSGSTSTKLDGFTPMDIHANTRTRKYYVSAPTVMDAKSFIFPICHDAVLYQRIKELQANRRAIRRDVVDNTLMDVLKEEGKAIGGWGVVDMFDAVFGGVSSITAAEGNEDGKTGTSVANKANNKDRSKGGDANKKKGVKESAGGSEKKSDSNSNGKNFVGAGLLDGDDVDASWPGLNSLLRGKLW